ncbi:hypothetical protein HCN44_006471 [Aphidius gifuensis]|uniref:Uncharacterized protein n=1 Tax=Aphidius gifuensis TaxID=684658 RepID=A0A834Y1H2_APHGI|nr:uncharacterized protein LOC122850248 isoform X2 [Aphidius gifuensis]KAF7995364.1 hypothetical protein HCN44_006471 [Aphidius gifuensis]
MTRQGVNLFVIFALLSIAIAKSPPGPSPWSAYASKPVYARALGPPGGIGSITVPYKPKVSPFFPKFVDPSMMIAKKTDMLSNFFGGTYPGTLTSFYGPAKPAPSYADDTSKDVNDLEEILGDKSSSPLKRGIFGPVVPKVGPVAPKFGPFGPKFGPGSLPFTPFGPFGGKFGSYDGSDVSGSSETATNSFDSRRKRSITDTASVTPPPYPGLGPIAEESEDDTAGIPKSFFPGMFGPFGSFKPVSPFAASPVVDPTIFISKKKSFLDSLFKTLATSTPATAAAAAVTDAPVAKPTDFPADFWSSFETVTAAPPVAKSTVVPPGYWAPSAIIPGPLEYSNKVSDFLDKLFDSIKLNKTTVSPKIARSLISENEFPTTKVARSVDDFTTISAAKDAIVDSIIDELTSLKTDMFNTMNDFIAAQTPAVPVSPFPTKPTKPGKVGKPIKPTSPFKAAFASMWAPPPPVDTTLPFKQKMTVLSQVFDMLTGLQKNITLAIQDSIAKSSSSSADATSDDLNAVQSLASSTDVAAQLNSTLLDAIKNKLDSLDAPAPVDPFYVGKYARALSSSSSPGSGTPFWANSPSATEKRQANYDGNGDDDDDVYEEYQHNQNNNNNNHDQFKRGVKMAMHQGYQSMPPGTIESVQAGGGSVPGHQGGGIKLLEQENGNYEDYSNQWTNWVEYMKNQNEGRRNNHHHNRH